MEKALQTLSSASGHKINEIRFVALIESSFDAISSQNIPFEYTVTLTLYSMIEEQRLAHVSCGEYVEAGEAQTLLDNLFNSEVTQRHHALYSKQTRDLANLEKAHDDQYIAFNNEWDAFAKDFDNRSDKAVNAMKDRHTSSLKEHTTKLEIKERSKPKLFSKELKEWRKKQKILAYQENYSEAQKIKVISDAIEEEERMSINANCDSSAAKKAIRFEQQQEAELKALIKRIVSQKEANKQQREVDCKRLLQRNHNIQATLKSKQANEGQRQFASIEKEVQSDIAQLKKFTKCSLVKR